MFSGQKKNVGTTYQMHNCTSSWQLVKVKNFLDHSKEVFPQYIFLFQPELNHSVVRLSLDSWQPLQNWPRLLAALNVANLQKSSSQHCGHFWA